MIDTVVIIEGKAAVDGGTAQVAIDSAAALSKKGFQVIYVSADEEESPEITKSGVIHRSLDILGINTDPNRIRAAVNGIWNRKAARGLKEILEGLDREHTLVHVHGYVHFLSPSIFAVCKSVGVPTVLTLHDYFTVCPGGGFYDYGEQHICTRRPMSLSCLLCNCDKRSYMQKLWRIARQMLINRYVRFNKTLKFIYISEFSFQKIKGWLSGQKCFYVRNPYDLGSEAVYHAEKSLNYVYVGRISEEKGVDLFCEVMSELARKHLLRGEVLVVGDGDGKNALEQRYPEIAFLGWKSHPELAELMKNVRCLIVPSKWYEGSPLTPIEFMAHGIPCIVSDCCAAVEYVDSGKTGLLFEHEKKEDLMKKVLEAEDDSRWSEIAADLRDTFDRRTYSVESHIERLLQVYNQILREKT